MNSEKDGAKPVEQVEVESVWDYPRPPAVEACHFRVRVEFGGVVIVDSDQAQRVLETSHPPTYYVPLQDVRENVLVPSARRSYCEFKGSAHYFDIAVGDSKVKDAAWCYPHPTSRFKAIKDHVAFYAHVMDACFVGDELVQPQAGGFYGGWVTSKIKGPFKGAPGTQGW